MRERKKIHGKIAALTAQGKASGIVMGCVPFILLAVLYFIQPSMMGLLFTTFLGNVMLCVVVIMITVGMVVINKIVSIDI
jgi:tight adherence protein B